MVRYYAIVQPQTGIPSTLLERTGHPSSALPVPVPVYDHPSNPTRALQLPILPLCNLLPQWHCMIGRDGTNTE